VFRAIALTALGVVLGFVLGGLGPRREVSELTVEVEELKQKLERMDRPNPLRALLPQLVGERDTGDARDGQGALPTRVARATSQGAGMGEEDSSNPNPQAANDHSAVIIRGSEAERAGASTSAASPGQEPGPIANGTQAPADAKTDDSAPRRRGFEELNLARFDEMSAAQAVRFAASRAALIEQAGLNEKETAAVDETVKKMNDDLSGYGEEILSQASAEEAPSPAQALGLGHDVSGIMYEGQKQIDGILGERADAVDPEATQIWNFIDMKRLRPAAEKFLPKDGGKGASTASTTGGAATGTPKPETDKEPE